MYDSKQGHQAYKEQEHQHKKAKEEWMKVRRLTVCALSRYEAGNYSIKRI